MATAFEGEAIVGITSINLSLVASGTVAYTVPAGRYAKIHIYRLESAAGAPTVTGSLSNLSSATVVDDLDYFTTTNDSKYSYPLIMQSGDTLAFTGGTYTMVATVLEFTNP